MGSPPPGGGDRLRRLLVAEHRPAFRLQRRRRIGLGPEDLHQMADIADPHAAPIGNAGPILVMGKDAEAVAITCGSQMPGIRTHGIEIDDIAVGRDSALSTQGDGGLYQRGVTPADDVEEHG